MTQSKYDMVAHSCGADAHIYCTALATLTSDSDCSLNADGTLAAQTDEEYIYI